MKELKCPKCGNVFQVDEADYASIVSQVKNAEFEAEIERRLAEMNKRLKTEQQLANAQTEQSFQTQLSKKDMLLGEKDAEIGRLKMQLQNIESLKTERTGHCPCRERPDHRTAELHHCAKRQ